MGCEFNLFVQDMEFCFDQAVSRATEGRFLIGKIINLSLVQAPGLIWFSRVHASINSVPEYKSQLFILLMGHLTLVSSDHLPLRSCSFSNVCLKKNSGSSCRSENEWTTQRLNDSVRGDCGRGTGASSRSNPDLNSSSMDNLCIAEHFRCFWQIWTKVAGRRNKAVSGTTYSFVFKPCMTAQKQG